MKKSPRQKSLGGQMAIALQLMKKENHLAIANAGHKITMEQLVVLEMLKFQGDMNMTELSNAVWKQNANITRIVDKLEKWQLIERKDIPEDRRANLICLTTKGKELFKDVIPIVLKTQKDVLSCITKEEKATTLKTLKKIIAHLSRK